MKVAWKRWIGIAGLLIGGAGCTKAADEAKVDATPLKDEKPVIARTVNLAIWSNYISDEFLKDFEKQTGIRVVVSNYSSNEELLGKLQAGATGYDVIVPSDYMIQVMAKLGILAEIQRDQVPNALKVDPQYLSKPFDPENKFSLPYGWGTTGIAVNRNLYKKEVKSWKDLLDNATLAGKFSILDDVREALGAALKSKGYSLNTADQGQLQAAKDVLLKAKKSAKAFDSEPLSALVSGEVVMAHAYSSDAMKARAQSGGAIDYIIPEEGGTIWIDSLAIPKTAVHPKEAHELVNYLLEAKVNLSRASRFFTAPVVQDAVKLLPAELQGDQRLFPPKSKLARAEFLTDLGEATTAWDRIWTEVKSAP